MRRCTFGGWKARARADPAGSFCDAVTQECLLHALFDQLFEGELDAAAKAAPPRRSPHVRRLVDMLRARFEESVSIEEAAASFGVSCSYLIRAFVAEHSISPHQFQLHLRILRARTLLTAGTSPAEVAASVGFVDQSHLHRHFRRIVGVTPSAYARATR
jgi:transcriptional regulator GlxA family with amidase domain